MIINISYRNKIILIGLFYFFLFEIVFASAWTRGKNDIFIDFELLNESDYSKRLIKNINLTNYKINSYKFYFEYGLINYLTIGGYLKNYNFEYQYKNNYKNKEEKIRNDYYGDIFLLYNFYNKNRNLISAEVSFYFPIKTHMFSKEFNLYDTENSFEYSILFGTDKDFDFIYNFMVFNNSKISYRIFNNINFNRFTFETIFGFRLNKTSSVNFEYEYQNNKKTNILSSNITIYDKMNNYNLNQLKISFNYKFLDNLSTKLSYFRKFSKVDSVGFTFSFIFEK